MDDLHQLTREGKNLCSCGKPKIMYYKPWCPICEKSEVVYTVVELNFFKALYHLEAIGHKYEADLIKNDIIDYDEFRNDTSFHFSFKYSIEDADDVLKNAYKLLQSTFNLEDEIKIFASW